MRWLMKNFKEMLEYVKKALEDGNGLKSRNPHHQFRDRFMHTVRVLKWCKVIQDDLECDLDVLYTSAIFHDIGNLLIDKSETGWCSKAQTSFRTQQSGTTKVQPSPQHAPAQKARIRQFLPNTKKGPQSWTLFFQLRVKYPFVMSITRCEPTGSRSER